MAVSHWNHADAPAGAWDVCYLGGTDLPGVATVDVAIKSDLDVKKPDGSTGATIRDKGDPPAEVTIKLTVDTLEELDGLDKIRTYLRPKSKGGGREPLEIVHPNPNFWGITAVTVVDIDSPSPSARGGWEIALKCLEWFPAPKPTPVGKKTPKSDSAAWAPYVDNSAVGSGVPSKSGAAVDNMGLENRRGG